MNIYLIGGSSIIGQDIHKYFTYKGVNITSTYCNNKINGMIKFDLNIDKFDNLKPAPKKEDIVIILSAVTNVKWAFYNQELAYDFNTKKIINLIDDIKKVGCKIYYMSSAEVFEGDKGGYDEFSIPNPVNFYGKTKYNVEIYLKKNIQNFTIIRTGWNVSDKIVDRCPIKQTIEALSKRNCIMAEDNKFTLTHSEDLAKGLYELIYSQNFINEVAHLCSNKAISRINLADLVIKASKQKSYSPYKTVKFKEIDYPEPRARLNDLSSEYTLNHLNLKFRLPEKIIKDKVAIIERNLNE
ncbi:sugar nucleotide-binding protein [Pelagibacteraceae bacterium]|nr:sugar nucleotide-binding protein [Pelagibacteraceae bacterium]